MDERPYLADISAFCQEKGLFNDVIRDAADNDHKVSDGPLLFFPDFRSHYSVGGRRIPAAASEIRCSACGERMDIIVNYTNDDNDIMLLSVLYLNHTVLTREWCRGSVVVSSSI
jgi:hypothetical protein